MFWITFSFDFPKPGCDTAQRSGSVGFLWSGLLQVLTAPLMFKYNVSVILITNQRASQDEGETGRLLRPWPGQIKPGAGSCCLLLVQFWLWWWDDQGNLDGPFGREGFKVAGSGQAQKNRHETGRYQRQVSAPPSHRQNYRFKEARSEPWTHESKHRRANRCFSWSL